MGGLSAAPRAGCVVPIDSRKKVSRDPVHKKLFAVHARSEAVHTKLLRAHKRSEGWHIAYALGVPGRHHIT